MPARSLRSASLAAGFAPGWSLSWLCVWKTQNTFLRHYSELLESICFFFVSHKGSQTCVWPGNRRLQFLQISWPCIDQLARQWECNMQVPVMEWKFLAAAYGTAQFRATLISNAGRWVCWSMWPGLMSWIDYDFLHLSSIVFETWSTEGDWGCGYWVTDRFRNSAAAFSTHPSASRAIPSLPVARTCLNSPSQVPRRRCDRSSQGACTFLRG